MGVVGNVTLPVSTEALGILFPSKTPAAPATVGVILPPSELDASGITASPVVN